MSHSQRGRRDSGGSDSREGGSGNQPAAQGSTTLDEESRQARKELDRSASGLLLSGILAGLAIGTSLFLMAAVRTSAGGVLPEPVVHILQANAYAVGFVLVILAHVDLFTEYTTMALLPVLGGDEPVRRLLRLWGLVFVGNIAAAAGFALLVATLGPQLGVVEPHALGEIARGMVEHQAWVMLLSGSLAGFLMGILSWLVSAGRDTTSQIVFVWLIAGTLGYTELHHCITGTVEVLAGVFARQGIGWSDYGRFLFWATLGNIGGAVVFALLMRYSVTIGGGQRGARGLRSG